MKADHEKSEEPDSGLSPEKLILATGVLSDLIETTGPIRLDKLLREVGRMLGLRQITPRIKHTLLPLIPNHLIHIEADGERFVWPRTSMPQSWTGYPAPGSVTSVSDVSLVELSNLLRSIPEDVVDADDEVRYRIALGRLGLTRLTASARRRLSSALELARSKQTQPGDAPYSRWAVTSSDSLAPIVGNGTRRGIYILEFADASKYVGMATNIVSRFTSHTHGSAHHPPWDDVIALNFRAIPTGDLRVAEIAEIRRQRDQGSQLRNRTGVPESIAPSPLDDVIPSVDLDHWSLGDPDACHFDFSSHPVQHSDTRSTLRRDQPVAVYDAVLDDLAYALEHIVPQAPITEKEFWALSDSPSTAGGRFATLNTGSVELLVFPTWLKNGSEELKFERFHPEHQVAFINTDLFDPTLGDGIFQSFYDLKPVPFAFTHHHYRIDISGAVYYPVGSLKALMEANDDLLVAARNFALSMMKYRHSGLFRRFHSTALTDEAYRKIQHPHWDKTPRQRPTISVNPGT